MKTLTSAALAVICTAISVNAQQFSADDLARRTIERRAIEADELGHVGGQHRPDAAGDAEQDGGQGEPGRLLVASARLAQPDAHAQS